MHIQNSDKQPMSLAAIKRSCTDEEKAFMNRVVRVIMNKYSVIEEAVRNQKDPLITYIISTTMLMSSVTGSLALEFADAWKEGDGERITCC